MTYPRHVIIFDNLARALTLDMDLTTDSYHDQRNVNDYLQHGVLSYSTVSFLTGHVWTWTDISFDPVPFLHFVVLDLANTIPDI